MATAPDIYSDLCGQLPATPTCTFADMLPAFQELFEPEPGRLIALIGRIKFLITSGAIGGKRAGKGRTQRFTSPDVWELAMLMELTQIGFPPAKAIELYPKLLGQHLPVSRASMLKIETTDLIEALGRHLPWMIEGLTDGE
jgi:hypothetical protein